MKFKLIISACALSVCTLISSCQSYAAQQTPISVYFDGKDLSMAQKPTVINGSTLIPMRSIFEQFGASVKWDNATDTVTASKDKTQIKVTVGKYTALKNGQNISMKVSPKVINNTLYVPLRFVSESFGSQVSWLPTAHTVTINSFPTQSLKIDHIRDGDTFEGVYTSGKQKGERAVIRLIGVDTPETVKANTPVQNYGPEASAYTKSILSHQTVYISTDQSNDIYGRTLAYVFLENGLLFNADLVSKGYARAMTIAPNTRWSSLYTELEGMAKNESMGLWNTNNTDTAITSMLEESNLPALITDSSAAKKYVSQDEMTRLLIMAIFPETKAVFLAKSFYDLSQDEKVQKTTKLAIEKGITITEAFINSKEPVTLSTSVQIISDALDINPDQGLLLLQDLKMLPAEGDTNQLLSIEASKALIQKVDLISEPLKSYTKNIKVAASQSKHTTELAQTLPNKEFSVAIEQYAIRIKDSLIHPEQLQDLLNIDSLLVSAKSLASTDWTTIVKQKDIIESLTKATVKLKQANQSLQLAKKALTQ
ncbi:N-acetylmuramoyl-L-alanine amidase [Paenibacillus nuruki]|uniref:N-acetylmuramoyl-L-alanine amidase n=1 Tax=Paenibacillus nuruki TaxID=1886670 RepID=A0A1E3L0B4_9BACL|nr:stalk domain-containing protein [Paenibacillus nuruki]ODP26625.1 N-acetylmuramoyl-L-alanine amidase [Paenibacillus nuruki]